MVPEKISQITWALHTVAAAAYVQFVDGAYIYDDKQTWVTDVWIKPSGYCPANQGPEYSEAMLDQYRHRSVPWIEVNVQWIYNDIWSTGVCFILLFDFIYLTVKHWINVMLTRGWHAIKVTSWWWLDHGSWISEVIILKSVLNPVKLQTARLFENENVKKHCAMKSQNVIPAHV